MSKINFSHIGLCVSDLEKSLRFYCEGLGFEKVQSYSVGNECKKALEVKGDVSLTSEFISRDGFTIELLYYTSPGVHGEPSNARNQLGLTHISLYVDDIDAAGGKLIEMGGTRLDNTMTMMAQENGDFMKLVFFADPDGGRVELMELVQGKPEQ